MRLWQRIRRRIERFSASYGAYRFLVGRWDHLTDLDVIARAMDTEFFRREIKPVELPALRKRSYLLIAPHQDDESIGAAGTLSLAADAGCQVNVLFATDGVQLNTPESPAEIAAIREEEAQRACRTIGAQVHHLGLWNPRPEPTLEHLDSLAALIERLAPDVLMVPWLFDSPPKHRLMNHLLWLTNLRRPLPACEVWGYQVHNTVYPNGYVDITDVIGRKRDALRCYESQNRQFRPYDHVSVGLSAWNARYLPVFDHEETHRYAELFFSVPLQEHLELVEKFYFRDIPATYQGDSDVYEPLQALHHQVEQESQASRSSRQARKSAAA